MFVVKELTGQKINYYTVVHPCTVILATNKEEKDYTM